MIHAIHRHVRHVHKLFNFGIGFKFASGCFEIMLGLVTLFIGKRTLDTLFSLIVRKELIEDPHDALVGFFGYSLDHFSASSQLFAGIYILCHGFLNIFMALELRRQRRGAYKIIIGILSVLALYQIIRFLYTHSLLLALITAWDLIFIAVIWYEHRSLKK